MKVLIHTSSATSTKFQEKGKKKEKQNPFKKAQYNSYFYDFSFYLIISYSFSQKNNSQQFHFLSIVPLSEQTTTNNKLNNKSCRKKRQNYFFSFLIIFQRMI
jgi:hypothetical protein